MKKSVVVLALALGFSISNLIASNEILTSDVNAKSNGMQPIHYAAKYNRVDLIKVLITAGSEIHTPCDKGYTALRHAKKAKANDAAQFLKRFKNKNV
jgi:ankyrin repeat protein